MDNHLFEYSLGDLRVQVGSFSLFDTVLRREWDRCQKEGLFRYKFKDIPFKILPGEFQFIAQLNPDRAQKRRKPQEIQSLSQPFNPDAFNFLRIPSNEILIGFQPSWIKDPGEDSKSLLLINVSPLEYGHVLLVPFIQRKLPQIITVESLHLAIDVFLLSGSSDFRLGFNSLCGYASVNHLHFHSYYLKHRLYIEFAELRKIKESCPVYIFANERYPGKGFAFVLKHSSQGRFEEHQLEKFINEIYKLTSYLQASDNAHNLFITRGSSEFREGHFDSVRVYLWARESSFGSKECDGFNPALCELAGHFPIKSEAAYEKISEELICKELDAITSESFQVIKDKICSIYEK